MAVAKAKAKSERRYTGREVKAIESAVELFKRQTEARYRLARAAFDHQDEPTQNVILAIMDRLRIGATGMMRVFPDGKQGQSHLVPIEPEYQDYNLMYVATEILKDLALMDVKVAGYEFPKVYCADCGDKLTMPKRKKSRRA